MSPTPPILDGLEALPPPNSFAARIDAWLETGGPPLRSSVHKKRARSPSDPLPSTTSSHHKKQAPYTHSYLDLTSSLKKRDKMPGEDQYYPSPLPSIPKEASDSALSQTPTASTTSRASKNVGAIGPRLESHLLFHDPAHLETNYPEEYKNIQARLGRTTMDGMAEDSVKRFRKFWGQYKDRKEDSFLCAVLPLLLKNTYTPAQQDEADVGTSAVQESLPGQANTYPALEDPFTDNPRKRKAAAMTEVCVGDIRDGQRYLPKFWSDDGIIVAVNEQFKKGCLPGQLENDDLVTKQMRKDDGMTTPKPDRTLCLDPNLFPLPPDLEPPPAIQSCLEILTNLWHPFLLVEGKSANSRPVEATIQVRRGGAAAVHSLRNFLDMAGIQDIEIGFDQRSYIYSMTITPEYLLIWIHYAEKQNDGVIHYHMSPIADAPLVMDYKIPQVRRILDNIQSRGCHERLEELRVYHAALHDMLRREKRAEQEKQEKRAESATTARGCGNARRGSHRGRGRGNRGRGSTGK